MSFIGVKDFINPHKAIQLIFIVLVLAFAGLVFYACYDGRYFIMGEDETIYYNSTRIFNETSSVRAVSCINENVSKIWSCNWYGPVYNLFYGSIAKLVGFHIYNFIAINIACLLVIVVLIWRTNFSSLIKFVILSSFFSLFAFVKYSFNMYPETLQLLFAVILTLQLKKLFDKSNTNQSTRNETLVFIGTALFFSLFRVETVFWVFGLMAFSTSVKDLINRFSVGLVCFIVVFAYIKFFNAPFYAPNSGVIMGGKMGIATLVNEISIISKNIVLYFTVNSFFDLVLFMVFLITLFAWYLTKNRMILAACIITSIYYIVLLTLYTFESFNFNKQTACLLPLMIVAVVCYGTPASKKAIFFFVLLFAPLTYLETFYRIRDYKGCYDTSQRLKPITSQLEQIRYKVADGKPTVICLLNREMDKREFNKGLPIEYFLPSLPVSTLDHYPITYSSTIPSFPNGDTAKRYEDNFQVFGRLHVDYFMSAKPLNMDSVPLVYHTDLYYLYKNNRKQK
ncbi:MAG TPA: hypothetical protein VN922_07280, partial [Bacteroidia bacterium]|nr:hypothetical protein [Bacteroidia bacterium]